MSYLKSLQSLSTRLSAANCTPVVVTAEPASHLPETRKASGYTGAAIVDPENVLAEDLRKRGLLDIAISSKGGYEHGMAQPGILVLKRDGTDLYHWAIVPGIVSPTLMRNFEATGSH
jgi:hypothetical protein